MHLARQRLITLIETTALSEGLTMEEAQHLVMADATHLATIIAAKTTHPLRHQDPDKKFFARRWPRFRHPDLTPMQFHYWVAPYLAPRNRPPAPLTPLEIIARYERGEEIPPETKEILDEYRRYPHPL